jgi:feruloyl esterase
MLAYLPPGLGEDAPLVVALHGCGQSATGFAYGAGWMQLADEMGFALLCPEQRPQNNINRCFNWFQPDDVGREGGEAQSIFEMTTTLSARHGLDDGRVFVTGLSAGGAMAAALLASFPEVYAAGASIAGLPVGAADSIRDALGAMLQGRRRPPEHWAEKVRAASANTGRWPRLSIWHGDADKTVHPLNAEALAAQWAHVHGQSPDPAHVAGDGPRLRKIWGPREAPLVELHVLAGVGHGVPLRAAGADGVGEPGPFLLETGVSAAREIAGFWGLDGRDKPPRPPARRPARPAEAPKPQALGQPQELLDAPSADAQPPAAAKAGLLAACGRVLGALGRRLGLGRER